MTAHVRQNSQCLVCGARSLPAGPTYGLRQLLGLWAPVVFRLETVDSLASQAVQTRLFECPRCGLAFFAPQIIGTDNFYQDIIASSNSRYYEPSKWDFTVALESVRPHQELIEFGCGPGHFLEMLRARGAHPVGIEYNAKAIEAAQRRGFNVFESGEEVPRGDLGMDGAFCFHVLEHVPDPANFMRRMMTMVKPGGFIGVSTPNQAGPLNFIDPCAENMPPHHATRWRRSAFLELAAQVGLNVEQVRYEPLTPKNSYFYSWHWVHHLIPGRGAIASLSRAMASRVLTLSFEGLFKALAATGRGETGLLRGQAMYVLFRMTEAA